MLNPTVYFLFDAKDQIIYIGSSLNLQSRIIQHKNTKEWFREVAAINYKTYKNKSFMLKWEKLFILDLSPKYNKKDKILCQEDSENLFENQLGDIIKNKISIKDFFASNLEDDFKKNERFYISKEEKELKRELRKQERINKIIERYKKKNYKIVQLCNSEVYSFNLFNAPFDFSPVIFKYNDIFIEFEILVSNPYLNNMSSIDLIKRFLSKKENLLKPEEILLSLKIVKVSGFCAYRLFRSLTVDKEGYLIDIQWSDYSWLMIEGNNIYVNLDMLVKEV